MLYKCKSFHWDFVFYNFNPLCFCWWFLLHPYSCYMAFLLTTSSILVRYLLFFSPSWSNLLSSIEYGTIVPYLNRERKEQGITVEYDFFSLKNLINKNFHFSYFDVPVAILPEVRSSSEIYGYMVSCVCVCNQFLLPIKIVFYWVYLF